MTLTKLRHSVTLLLLVLAPFAFAQTADGPQVVTLDSSSPLIEVRIMVKAGSMHDPVGKEGLASITADALLEGGFGPSDAVVTKEELARRTSAWGGAANPSVSAGKETTTFSMVIPRDVLDRYVTEILRPLFASPRFDADEIARLKNESSTYLSSALRYTQTEMVGLEALDNYVFAGTPRGHAVSGTVQGLAAIEPADVRGFFNAHYRPGNMIVGVSTTDETVIDTVVGALAGSGNARGAVNEPETPQPLPAPAIEGREAVVVKVADSGATGVHFAHPLPVDRRDEDFWPLWVANVHLGTHRDSHGVLYKQIREERGYNYGDYSYVEHFPYRPYALFPPFNFPRTENYFSVWIRPVSSDHAHHLLKAAAYEYERMISEGLSEEQVEASKNKARVLYLNYAETASRLLAAKVDDAYFGMEPGYLEGYLDRIDAITTEQVNAAIRRYMSTDDLKILLVAEGSRAEDLAQSIREDGVVYGKQPADYRLESTELDDGTTLWEVPENRLETLRLDAVWAHHRLDVDPDRVRLVPVRALFESRDFIDEEAAQPDAR
jgi:zinc protease